MPSTNLPAIVELTGGEAWSWMMAAAEMPRNWPDAVDLAALLAFAGIAFGLPVFGYVLMVGDIRRYLRSLRRALIVIGHAVTPGSPYWVTRTRPPCLETLGLHLPCTEEQVLAAYRQKVKEMHPDRGGNLQNFLRLQKHFEQAMYLARSQAKVRTAPVK